MLIIVILLRLIKKECAFILVYMHACQFNAFARFQTIINYAVQLHEINIMDLCLCTAAPIIILYYRNHNLLGVRN